VTVSGAGGLRGGEVVLDALAVLAVRQRAAPDRPRFQRGVDVRHDGGPLPSAPHLAMTVAALRGAGAQVDDGEPGRWHVAPGRLARATPAVEPDLSTAAAYLAAPLVAAARSPCPAGRAAPCSPGRSCPSCSRPWAAGSSAPTTP
jgi:3-phosphoshikimate 1-carboxyvinyltransferase